MLFYRAVNDMHARVIVHQSRLSNCKIVMESTAAF